MGVLLLTALAMALAGPVGCVAILEPFELMELLVPPRAYVTRSELLVVEGPPVAWKRARRNGNSYFTDPKMKGWQNTVRFQVQQQWRLPPVDGPCLLDVIACLPRPKKQLTTDGIKPDAPFFSVSHNGGDFDNHTKVVADSLQGNKKKNRPGILYHDDCQIVGGSPYKVYADGTAADLAMRGGGGLPIGVVIQFSIVDSEWRA